MDEAIKLQAFINSLRVAKAKQGQARRAPPPVKPDKKAPDPPLTIKKGDLAVMRQMNAKERHKRVKSWYVSNDQQIRRSWEAATGLLEKLKKVLSSELLDEDSKQKPPKFLEEGRSLQQELESLTNIRILGKDGKPLQKPNKGLPPGHKSGAASALDKNKRVSLMVPTNKNKPVRHSDHQQERHNHHQQNANQKLEMMADKAKAVQLKKTFGRNWDKRQSLQPVRKSVTMDDDAPPKRLSNGSFTPMPSSGGTRTMEDKSGGDAMPTSATPTTAETRKHSPMVRPHQNRPYGHKRTSRSSGSHQSALRTDLEELEHQTTTTTSRGTTAGNRSIKQSDLEKQTVLRRPTSPPSDNSLVEEDSDTSSPEESHHPRELDQYQEEAFGNVRYVEKRAIRPMDKKSKKLMATFDDPDVGLGMGRAGHTKVPFFKPGGPREAKARKKKQKHVPPPAPKVEEKEEEEVDHVFNEEPEEELLTEKENLKRLSALQRTILEIPRNTAGFDMDVQAKSGMEQDPDAHRRQRFMRPARMILYQPIPLAVKKYYRTNWKKIRYDVRKRMKASNFWPKLWINFEDAHPKQLYELIHAKKTVRQFDQFGFKKQYDWGRGVHPDYVDWMLEDVVPHPGPYYYNDTQEPVRRASFDEKDFMLKDWFVKPPRYIPVSPVSPPFDQYDFCGYGNRKKPFFVASSLPREILHYYAPPTSIEKFFRDIPKPPYVFPGYAFKRWLKFPLEQKLPQYYPFPARFSSWARGKIGDAIQHSSSPTNFVLNDPLIQKSDLRYNCYHDPHAVKYILRKDILDRIWELGIINSKGEVKCTMEQFNKYRRYLREYEWFEEVMSRWNLKWTDRQQHNRLVKHTNYDDLDWGGRQQQYIDRLRQCKAFAKAREEAENKKRKEAEEKFNTTLQHAASMKLALQNAMIERARNRRRIQIKLRKTIQSSVLNKQILLKFKYLQRHKQSISRRREYYMNIFANKLERNREVWEKRVEFNKRKVQEVRQMQYDLEEDFKRRSWKHQKRHLKIWRNIPEANLRHKLKLEYSRRVALKYGRIWLHKVRRRLYDDAPDSAHQSIWMLKKSLELTLTRIKKDSGYVPAKDFFFGALQAQTLLAEKPSSIHLDRPKTRKPVRPYQSENETTDIESARPGTTLSGEDADESSQSDRERNSYEPLNEPIIGSDGYEADDDEGEA